MFYSLAWPFLDLQKCYSDENWSNLNQESIGIIRLYLACTVFFVGGGWWVTDDRLFFLKSLMSTTKANRKLTSKNSDSSLNHRSVGFEIFEIGQEPTEI